MGAKKFLSWLIVGVVLIIISAIILAGNFLSGCIRSPRKPASMKEEAVFCKKGTYHTVVVLDGKKHVYCAPKIQK